MKHIVFDKYRWHNPLDVMPVDVGYDWVLIRFKERQSGFICVPRVAMWNGYLWVLIDDDRFMQEQLNNGWYELLEWKPIE